MARMQQGDIGSQKSGVITARCWRWRERPEVGNGADPGTWLRDEKMGADVTGRRPPREKSH